MGADLISTFAWFHLDEPQTVTLPGGIEHTWRPAKLDYDGAIHVATELSKTWTAEQMQEYRDRKDDFDLDEADQRDECRAEMLDEITGRINQVFEMANGYVRGGDPAKREDRRWWRDTDLRIFDSGIGFLYSGGMSWGDGPTDGYEVLTDLQDEDVYPGVTKVWTALGFFEDPYTVVGLVQQP